MKWILCGKNDAAVAALEFLAAQGDEVLVLSVRDDTGEDGWQRSLAAAARRLGVRCESPPRINSPAVIEQLAGFGARALVSIQYDQILRPALLDALPGPCLNLHFSLLPRHRGLFPIAWAVLAGDAHAGVTLHHIAPAIDAGDVVAQRRVAIGGEDTAREVYDRVSGAAVDLFRASHPFGDELIAQRLPQDAADASYHRAGELDFGQRSVDWRRPARELQCWLRALIFPPFQHPEIRCAGRTLLVSRVGAEIGPAAEAAPGVVVACGEDGARVACADGTLRIGGLFDPAGGELAGRGIAAVLRVGERLG